MKNMKVRQYSRLVFTIQQADDSSVSATFVMSGYPPHTENYEDGVAYFELDSPYTDVVGEFEYQINENFTSGAPDIYPNFDNCDGDCDLPVIEVCESIDTGSS